MALRVFYSNDLGVLQNQWLLRDQIPEEDSLLITPNPSLARSLKIFRAHKNEICAGLQNVFLEGFLWQTYSESYQTHFGIKPKLLQQNIVEHLLYMILKEQELIKNQPTLYHYLYQEDKFDSGKALAIAKLIANLFLEYQYHRPVLKGRKGIENSWPHTPLFFEGEANEIEAWQIFLYDQLFTSAQSKMAKYNEGLAEPLLTLPRIQFELRDKELKIKPKQIHLFGISQMSAFHRLALSQIASQVDIFLYLLNPCQEYWEDVRHPKKAERIRDEFENEWLSQWGKTGKDSIKLWSELMDFEGNEQEEEFVENPKKTCLAEIQNQIKNRTAFKKERYQEDESVSVSEYNSIFDEIKNIRQKIEKLLKSENVSLKDIVVYVPDVKKYRPAFELHWGKRIGPELNKALPWQMSRVEAGLNLFGKFMVPLLECVLKGMTRESLIEWFRHPWFAEYLEVDQSTIENFFKLAEKKYIYNSAKKNDRDWDWLVKAIWLNDLSDLNGLGVVRDREYHAVQTTDSSHHLARFVLALENICWEFKEQSGDIKNRNSKLIQILKSIMHPILLKADVLGSYENWITHLEELEVYDRFNVSLEYKEYLDWILEVTKKEMSFQTNIGKGIRIEPLRPMNVVQAKHIFVCGLEEGSFPQNEKEEPLDLRKNSPWVGDLKTNEQQKYLFLEIFTQAKESIHLSYVCFDESGKKPVEPGEIIVEVKGLVDLKKEKKLKFEEIPIEQNLEIPFGLFEETEKDFIQEGKPKIYYERINNPLKYFISRVLLWERRTPQVDTFKGKAAPLSEGVLKKFSWHEQLIELAINSESEEVFLKLLQEFINREKHQRNLLPWPLSQSFINEILTKSKKVYYRVTQIKNKYPEHVWVRDNSFIYVFNENLIEVEYPFVFKSVKGNHFVLPLLGHSTEGKLGLDKFFKPFVEMIFLLNHCDDSLQQIDITSLESEQSISISKEFASSYYKRSLGVLKFENKSFDIRQSMKGSLKSKPGQELKFSEYENIYFKALNQRISKGRREGLIDELMSDFEELFK